MIRFADLSVKNKLTVMTTAISGITLVATAMAFLQMVNRELRTNSEEETTVLTRAIGANCAAALAFQDPESAFEQLGGLRTDPDIIAAWLYDQQSKPFASYHRGDQQALAPPPVRDPGRYYDGDSLLVFEPVDVQGVTLGTIGLMADTHDAALQWKQYATVAVLALAATLVAFLLSARWQSMVTAPLVELAATARRVSVEKNYTLAAARYGRDEIGTLVDDFNSMLEQIHARDLELAVYRNELEKEVAAQTRDLTRINEELRQALEKEKELGELKMRFVGLVSHEFRTPMTIIQSSAELMERNVDKYPLEKRIAMLRRIQSTVKHMNTLITNVLMVSRAESGRLEVYPEWVDLAAFVTEVADEIESAVAGRNPVAVSVDGEPRRAYLDPQLLRFVLHNLLSNASKYSPQGSPVTVEVVFARSEFLIMVADRGIGIPEEDMKQMFSMFHRAGNVGSVPGTGLGLANARRFVELEGGEIMLESRAGEGTTVTVVLPDKSPDETGEQAAGSAEMMAGTANWRTSK